MSLDSAISSLVSRLEVVTARLEKVEGQLATGARASGSSAPSAASASGGDPSEHPAVREFDNLINQYIRPYADLSGKVAPEVGKQAELVVKAVEAQKQFIAVAVTSKKPADAVLQQLVKPTADLMGEIGAFREANRTSKFFNNLSTVSEGIAALGWVLVSPTPGPHIADMRGGSEFYSNRVLKDFKGKDQTQVDWVTNFNSFLKDLQVYVKNHHTTGLTWNPNGGDAASAKKVTASAPAAAPAPAPTTTAAPARAPDTNALFGALNKGTDVTSGLKKVTNDMKSKNQPNRTAIVSADSLPKTTPKAEKSDKPTVKKPARVGLDGNKWTVEYQDNNRQIVIDETETRHVVYIFGCVNSTVQIKGKVNSVAIHGCKRTAVVFESAISGIEIVNSQSIEVQITGKVPNIAIDKTDGVQLYLSKHSVDAEIVTSKSSEMNVLLPAEGEADPIEVPIPEQFKTLVVGKTLKTEAVHHSG